MEHSDPPPDHLRIWTFNVLRPVNPTSSDSDVEVRTQMVIDAIGAEQPDLIALQEIIDSDAVPNRAEAIATATGYHWAWQAEYSAVLYEEGIAVLSRWPILESDAAELPHTDMLVSTRYVLRAAIDSPFGPIDFYCTHMIALGTPSQSADQALAAYRFIDGRAGGTLAFFGGDLNANPDEDSMRFLRGEVSLEGETGDFTDSWLAVNPDDPGLTSTAEDPRNRIDYLYLVPSSAAVATVQSCKLIFDQQVDGVWASDHLGVSCDYSVE